MSGHSKWKKIKRQKSANDVKKGNLFTKLGGAITLAVREGGSGDPAMNMMLQFAIDKARQVNMPNSTIERAIKKGLGEGDTGTLEQVSYEIVGRDGIALIVDCFTDNTNRTLTDIRTIINETQYKLGSGGVSWQFEEIGQIIIEPLLKVEKNAFKPGEKDEYKSIPTEDLMLQLMDVDGVEDVEKRQMEDDDGNYDVVYAFTQKNRLAETAKKLSEMKYKVVRASLAKVAKNKLTVDEKTKQGVIGLIERLDESQDIEVIWTNVNL
jgi:YebC/PmpR family DNA-binding regulatory protein